MPRIEENTRLDASRARIRAEADRLFAGPLPLADAWSCLQQLNGRLRPQLSADELSGQAALAALAAGRGTP